MKTVLQHIRDQMDIPENREKAKEKPFPYLQLSEWNTEFENLMRARLVMGAFRYGPFWDIGTNTYNRIQGIARRLLMYETTGNLEYLVDISNLSMKEFTLSEHPLKHFKAGDDGEHVQKH